jgi:transcriptional regulator with XRE-family HTH domain
MSKSAIGERIKKIRAEQGLKQSELAEKVGVSRSVISQIEIGRIFPTIETLKAIAHNFGRDYKWLIEGLEENVSAEGRLNYPHETELLRQEIEKLKQLTNTMKETIESQQQTIQAQEKVIRLLEKKK